MLGLLVYGNIKNKKIEDMIFAGIEIFKNNFANNCKKIYLKILDLPKKSANFK